jgi:hypothetical protein
VWYEYFEAMFNDEIDPHDISWVHETPIREPFRVPTKTENTFDDTNEFVFYVDALEKK